MSPWVPEREPGHDDPRRARELLDRAVRRLGAPSVDGLEAIFGRWSEAVGPGVAAHARPASLIDGTLVVLCDDPAWASQLGFLATDLVARCAAVAGPGVVERIEVRVARPGAASPSRPSEGGRAGGGRQARGVRGARRRS